MHTYLCMCGRMYVDIHGVYMCIQIYRYTYYAYMCIHMHMHAHVHMCIHMYTTVCHVCKSMRIYRYTHMQICVNLDDMVWAFGLHIPSCSHLSPKYFCIGYLQVRRHMPAPHRLFVHESRGRDFSRPFRGSASQYLKGRGLSLGVQGDIVEEWSYSRGIYGPYRESQFGFDLKVLSEIPQQYARLLLRRRVLDGVRGVGARILLS